MKVHKNDNNSDLGELSVPRRVLLKEVRADFDTEGVYVYQAYKKSTGERAAAEGRFSEGFNFNRFTWIKPSLAWMMYRSDYAQKSGQECVLRIKISHDNFHYILKNAVPAIYDESLYPEKEAWQIHLRKAALRYQWDPARDLCLNKLPGSASLQIGIGPSLSRTYVNQWTLKIMDITEEVCRLRQVKGNKRAEANPFKEKLYDVPSEIRKQLGME